MEPAKRTYSALLVSSSEKTGEKLQSLLSEERFAPVDLVASAAAARRTLLERSYDVLVINAPLSDEFGTTLALDACEQSRAGVLLLVKDEHYPDISARAAPFGVLTLPKPTSQMLLRQTLSLLCGTRERLRRMEQKTVSLEEKMEEIRLVNRAKWLLIEQLQMTEPDAHRYIEKTAMDRCVTRRTVAESIIRMYQ